MLYIEELMELLPHRYPFILIDRIIEIEPGKRCTAIKNITINEPYFQGHFPNQPVMPGVLILESMAQAGAFLVLNSVEDPLSKNMFFSAVEKAKFRKPIIPGFYCCMVTYARIISNMYIIFNDTVRTYRYIITQDCII